MSLLGLEDDIQPIREPVDAWRQCNGKNLLVCIVCVCFNATIRRYVFFYTGFLIQKLYYDNPSEYALAFQTHILHSMYNLWQRPTTAPIRLFERSPFSSRYIFCEALRDWYVSVCCVCM